MNLDVSEVIVNLKGSENPFLITKKGTSDHTNDTIGLTDYFQLIMMFRLFEDEFFFHLI